MRTPNGLKNFALVSVGVVLVLATLFVVWFAYFVHTEPSGFLAFFGGSAYAVVMLFTVLILDLGYLALLMYLKGRKNFSKNYNQHSGVVDLNQNINNEDNDDI